MVGRRRRVVGGAGGGRRGGIVSIDLVVFYLDTDAQTNDGDHSQNQQHSCWYGGEGQ